MTKINPVVNLLVAIDSVWIPILNDGYQCAFKYHGASKSSRKAANFKSLLKDIPDSRPGNAKIWLPISDPGGKFFPFKISIHEHRYEHN